MRITQVDAFTDRPFAGNPAAICVLDGPAEERWMQMVAREMNLSETAYLHPEEDGTYRLRWFTPVAEVDLCGHATLAAAHVLWEEARIGPEAPARFRTRSGILTATRRDGWIELDFPAEPVEPAEAPTWLAGAVGEPIRFVGRNRMDLLVEIDADAALRALKPDIGRLGEIPVRGVIVTAQAAAGSGFDFVSRFFAPRVGIAEDPVCGSAHCALAPYWATRLGKDALMAYQASERGGVLRLRWSGDRVVLGGQAVTVMTGELLG
jgi:PhzF family phenazine biosynthesis protein